MEETAPPAADIEALAEDQVLIATFPRASPHLRATIAQISSLLPTLMPFVGLMLFCANCGRVLRGMACISAEAGLLSQPPRADHVLTRGIGS